MSNGYCASLALEMCGFEVPFVREMSGDTIRRFASSNPLELTCVHEILPDVVNMCAIFLHENHAYFLAEKEEKGYTWEKYVVLHGEIGRRQSTNFKWQREKYAIIRDLIDQQEKEAADEKNQIAYEDIADRYVIKPNVVLTARR